jgi:hypothetical protein
MKLVYSHTFILSKCVKKFRKPAGIIGTWNGNRFRSLDVTIYDGDDDGDDNIYVIYGICLAVIWPPRTQCANRCTWHETVLTTQYRSIFLRNWVRYSLSLGITFMGERELNSNYSIRTMHTSKITYVNYENNYVIHGYFLASKGTLLTQVYNT